MKRKFSEVQQTADELMKKSDQELKDGKISESDTEVQNQSTTRTGVISQAHARWFEKTGGICDECGKTYNSKRALTSHKRSVHGKLNLECLTCGKSFSVKEFLRRHERIHSENEFACSKCNKVCGTKLGLKNHVRYHHGDKDLKYECSHCGQRFYDITNRIQHQQKNHPHKCTHCSKRFLLKPHLKTHNEIHQCKMKTHNGSKLRVDF